MTSSAASSEKRPGLARKIQRWEVVALVLALFLIGAAAWNHWSGPGYVGTTRRVTLHWTCQNAIFWSEKDQDFQWWASGTRKSQGRITTGESTLKDPDSGEPQPREASGSLHFDTRDRATFRSDAGGTMPMEREKKDTFHTMACAFGPPP